MSEIHYGWSYVYSAQHCLVRCVGYRHDVLYGQVDTDIKWFLKRIADNSNTKIIEIESDEGHIHLLTECAPQRYIPNIVKVFRGASAKLLFEKHPELRQLLWDERLWNPGYFIATVSENTEEQIREYIRNQKKK